MSTKPNFAVVGAGSGDLALAGLVWWRGAHVTVYEQASQFQRIGAGIQMSPNACGSCGRWGSKREASSAFAPQAWAARV